MCFEINIRLLAPSKTFPEASSTHLTSNVSFAKYKRKQRSVDEALRGSHNRQLAYRSFHANRQLTNDRVGIEDASQSIAAVALRISHTACSTAAHDVLKVEGKERSGVARVTTDDDNSIQRHMPVKGNGITSLANRLRLLLHVKD